MVEPDGPLTIAMVAGEASGDNLGAALTREILKSEPGTRFIGVGGPAMITEGFTSDHDIEILSVNGFVDPLLRLPSLVRLLFSLRDNIVASGADCFVGIDSNFFNLLLAGMLKKRGIRTVQYVSPTVWAWRSGRVKKIARNVDLMMTLYPFETKVYEDNGVPVVFVGHPRANDIAPGDGPANQASAREQLGLPDQGDILAILPGSRGSEVNLSGRDFLKTAELLRDRVKLFVIPAANERRHAQLSRLLSEFPLLEGKVRLTRGQSREVMTAADAVLVNSGTATLEAMLLRKPMVMSYRLGKLTYNIVSRMVTTDWFALPNILAEETLVPEFIQDDADPQLMADAVGRLLGKEDHENLMQRFAGIHEQLQCGATPGRAAADAVLSLARKPA